MIGVLWTLITGLSIIVMIGTNDGIGGIFCVCVGREVSGTASMIIGGVVEEEGESMWGFLVKTTSKNSQNFLPENVVVPRIDGNSGSEIDLARASSSSYSSESGGVCYLFDTVMLELGTSTCVVASHCKSAGN
jgi:hypothetical protein